MFSSRLPWQITTNQLAELLAAKRAAGVPVLDLTESNPTHAGIAYPEHFLDALADRRAVQYQPEPFGLPAARDFIAAQEDVPADRVVLTASTSEAYSWIFKLLCDPGDEVLIPRPSYPLFEYLAALESVRVQHYPLFCDHGWFVDFHALRESITPRTRAIVLVNPNNPTGHFLRRHELDELMECCAANRIAIVSDEVFREYLIEPADDSVISLKGDREALCFTLGGLSKSAGLPQMKLAWTVVNGPAALVGDAVSRLEIIADTYLSAGTPVQCALPSLMQMSGGVRQQILDRLRTNLSTLKNSGLRFLPVEAGWYAVLPVSAEEEVADRLLRDYNVQVQPGFFYDFERSGYLVISLLTRPGDFKAGLTAIRAVTALNDRQNIAV